MQEKSSAFCASTVAVPAAFAVFAWGHGGEDMRAAGFAAALLAAGLAADVFALRRVRAPRPGWVLLLYLLCLLALAATVWSASPFGAARAALFLFLLTATIDVMMCLPVRHKRFVLYGMCIVTFLSTAQGIGRMLGHCSGPVWHNGLFAARFVNSAHYAALAAASVPLALGLMLSDRSALRRIGILLCAVGGAGGVILAQSRAVWLVAAVIYGALFLLLAVGATDMAPRHRRWLWVGGLVLLVVALGTGWFFRDALAARIASVSATRGQSLTHRLDVWRVGWDMIKANPFGVGLGCFGEEFLRYKAVPDRYIALRAHNELIQLTAELGWLGLLILCASGVMFLRDIVRTWFPLERLPVLVLCAGAAIDVFLWHSMVDFPLRLRANALFMAVLLGCMPVPNGPQRPRFRPAGVIAALLAAVALLSGASSMSAIYSSRADEHLRYARLAEAAPLLERAVRWMPLDPETRYEVGGIEYAKSLWSEPGEKRRRLERACDDLELSSLMAGSRGMTHLRWAWALADLGEDKRADTRFLAAIACDPTLGRYHVHYADFLLRSGRHAEAVSRYRQALLMFHDGGVVDPRDILKRVYRATGDAADLRKLTPADDHSQRILAQFLNARGAQ